MDQIFLNERKRDITHVPDIKNIYEYAFDSLNSLPKKYLSFIESIVIRVENFADGETLGSLSLEDKYDLLGLYRGTPLTSEHRQPMHTDQDIIYLYRCPLIRFCQEKGEDLQSIISYVVIHEIGHHFGYSDAELDWLEGAFQPIN